MRAVLLSALIASAFAAALPSPAAHGQANLTLPPIDPPATPQTCGALAALVKSQGSLVLGDNPRVYQRYVRDQTFCAYQQVASPAWVPTTDNPQCFIGYTCGDSNNDGGK
ncbi:hypothetical protein [Azorhizobium doebereinerae]|uniref:hypothetical protein n=1 Tax=Azorhizobium doebereinerae TaxID=281091 RepID=UPI0003FC559B|nr:hypothetical protein [Azorhizobium doebereinerae]